MNTIILLMVTAFRLSGILLLTLPEMIKEDIPDSVSSKDSIIVERLLQAAGRAGYLEARMETLAVGADTTFKLVPGPRYTIARITVDGIHDEMREWVFDRFSDLEHSPWSGNTMKHAIDDVLNRYESIGYPFASITVRHVIADSLDSLLRMRISVREGPLTRLEKLVVGDSVRTKTRTLSRMTGLSAGMVYNQSLLTSARARLLRSGYFSYVSEPILQAGSSADEVSVAFDLDERSLNSISGALGLSREGRVSGQAGLTLRNIAGSAREASFLWEGTDEGYSDFNLYYREPWVIGLPPACEVTIGQTVEDTLWIKRQGTVSLEWELSSGVFGTLGYSTTRVIPGENIESIAATRSEEGWGEFAWERRGESRLFITGYSARLRAGYETRRSLESGNTMPVVRLGFQGRRGFSLTRRVLFDIHGSWNRIISGKGELSQPELVWLGGTTSVRGYRDRQFRSDIIGWVRSEWSYSIDQASGAFVFTDAGYHSNRDDRWIFSYGFGLRAVLPIGVLDTAYAIPCGANPLDGRVHMIVSQQY